MTASAPASIIMSMSAPGSSSPRTAPRARAWSIAITSIRSSGSTRGMRESSEGGAGRTVAGAGSVGKGSDRCGTGGSGIDAALAKPSFDIGREGVLHLAMDAEGLLGAFQGALTLAEGIERVGEVVKSGVLAAALADLARDGELLLVLPDRLARL